MRLHRLVLAVVAVVALAVVFMSGSLVGKGKPPKPEPTANPEIAYAHRDGGPGEIKVMEADGANAITVFEFADSRWLGYPTWSPDGTQVAFLDDYNIWTIDIDVVDGKPVGSNLIQVTSYPDSHPPTISRPRWSPLGDRILFHRSDPSSLHLVDAIGGIPNLLYDPGDGRGVAKNSATWSPDGEQIAFRESGGGVQVLRLLDVDSGEIADTIAIPTDSSFFEWARTQDVLVFNNGGALWTLDLETAEIEKLASVGKHGSWSPDDSKIVFFTDTSGLVLKVYEFKNRKIRTRAYFGNHPDWRR